MDCTWSECDKIAACDQIDRNGKVWASLCKEHHDMLGAAMASLQPRRILACWVKANGGAGAMAQKLIGRQHETNNFTGNGRRTGIGNRSDGRHTGSNQ